MYCYISWHGDMDTYVALLSEREPKLLLRGCGGKPSRCHQKVKKERRERKEKEKKKGRE